MNILDLPLDSLIIIFADLKKMHPHVVLIHKTIYKNTKDIAVHHSARYNVLPKRSNKYNNLSARIGVFIKAVKRHHTETVAISVGKGTGCTISLSHYMLTRTAHFAICCILAKLIISTVERLTN